jgi:hypothetical protein
MSTFCRVGSGLHDPARKIGGAFFTTGGFDSFQALGNAVQLFFDKMLEATDRL